jgi:hypothetical protein
VSVRGTDVVTYCKDFSREEIFLNEKYRNGLPKNWPHKAELPRAWNEKDKEILSRALEIIPDVLLTDTVREIYRLRKSKDFPNPASSSDGILVIYDSAFDATRNVSQILTHELAHQNYLDLKDADSLDYRRAMGWRLELEPSGIFYMVGRKEGYIEEDGKYSPVEDYANNIEHFVHNPDKLKKVSPEAYAWISKKFGNSLKLKGKKK